ncbi:hypothetical protein N9165_02715 [Akkermansiaceae bacterium]|nr:hypothetical protein [Akkermansiaceae bacterium]
MILKNGDLRVVVFYGVEQGACSVFLNESDLVVIKLPLPNLQKNLDITPLAAQQPPRGTYFHFETTPLYHD